MKRRFLPAALPPPRMRCVRELARTEGQVHTGAADTGGVAAVRGRDSAVGKVFWAEAANSFATNESVSADGSCHARPGGVSHCEHITGTHGRNNDCSGRAIHSRSKKRFARAHGRHRGRSLPRGNFKPRRGGEKLAAQEISG